jgi:hypothetical protein
VIEQDYSPQASLPTQAVERSRQIVFGSSWIVDYNQIIEHPDIVENAAA